ncbi:MAG: ABC transporter permease subunit [Deltaproteobacteria bacterium]|nr:ABC transporter permease subunit [Deltaproteobacteria bacterium]
MADTDKAEGAEAADKPAEAKAEEKTEAKAEEKPTKAEAPKVEEKKTEEKKVEAKAEERPAKAETKAEEKAETKAEKAAAPKKAEKAASKSDPQRPIPPGSVGSWMHNTAVIAQREFASYFTSPLGYIVIGMFLLLVGVLVFFPFAFLVLRKASLTPMFNAISWLLPLMSPAIAMRTFAEEKRTGTLEMLITQPVRDVEVLFGKYLGALGLLTVAILATVTYPLVVSRWGELDWGPVAGGYLGLLLGGGAYVAFGVMVSSYTKDQITAFFVAFVVGGVFFLMNKALMFLPTWAAPWVEYLCPDYHFASISRGVIDARNIVYFLSVISACLLATARSLDSRRWS